jgi:hypothetical protein
MSSTAQRLPTQTVGEIRTGVLKKLQEVLLPEHADKIIALDLETEEYCLGKTSREAVDAFKERYPGQRPFVIRVDGGPVIKFYDRNSL